MLRQVASLCFDDQASQILEFAISMPLLAVLLVGIIDFSSAFSLKHKMDLALQAGGRVASVQPFMDVTSVGAANPGSTGAIRDAVAGYLTSVGVSDCGLAAAATGSPTGLAWTYTASTNCPGTLTLLIDRGATFKTAGTPQLTVEGIHLNISYPFQWRFGKVVRLVGGVGPTGVTQITADTVVQNLN